MSPGPPAAIALGGFDRLDAGVFRIYHRGADRAEAEHAASVLEAAVIELDGRLPTGDEPITLLLCSRAADFAAVAGSYALVNIGGIARSDESFMAVKTPALMPPPYHFDGVLRHELVHILLARNVNVDRLPRWLNEGLAMTLAREFRFASKWHVAQMYMRNAIIPYRALDMHLRTGPELAFGDAYAQSLSMTRYLQRELGDEPFWALIHSLDERRFGEALEAELGLTPFAFWQAWRGTLWTAALVSSIVSGFSVFQLAVVLSLWVYWRKKRQQRAILDAWDAEEAEPPVFTVWDLEDQDGPYPWEDDDDEAQRSP